MDIRLGWTPTPEQREELFAYYGTPPPEVSWVGYLAMPDYMEDLKAAVKPE